jgi:hypothetical protein
VTRVQLRSRCGARSGEKLDVSDITLFADDEPTYLALCDAVTPEAVAQHFGPLVTGTVERYLVPKVWALKFVLHGALGGGASAGLRSDGQGKTHGLALLRLWIDVPEAVAERAHRPRHPASTAPKPL